MSVPRFCDASMAIGAPGNLGGRRRSRILLGKVLAVAVWATVTPSLNFAGAVSRWQVACPFGRGRMALEAYSDMKVGELKALLKERGLKVGGLKAELVARLEESDGENDEEVEEDDEVEEEEAPSPPPPSAAKKKTGPAEYKAGQLALAKFHDDGRYYSVKLKKDNGDGSFDIVWLEDEAEDTANLEDLKPQLKDFKKGDLVLAKCAEDGRRYTALVQENKGEGYVTVQYIEDESEEEVLIDNVVKQMKKFKKGQKVEAKFPDDGEFYAATVKDDLGKGKYLIEWEDPDGSDPESEMLVDDIQRPRVNIDTFEIGQKLIGEVRRVVPFGAFVDVGAYTDGLVHVSKIANERIENPEDYVSEEDEITVWVNSIDTEQNRLGLTMVESKLGGRGGMRSREVTHPFADLQVGDELEGIVEGVRDFGAFVDVGSERSGLVHISRMSDGFVDNPHDFAAEGQKVTVWVSSVDDGRLGLTMVKSRL